MPSEDTQFKPGNPGGPGRPKGSISGRTGRTAALKVLDEVLSDPDNLEYFRDEMEKCFRRSPGTFFRKYVMPLLPKGAKDRFPVSESTEPH